MLLLLDFFVFVLLSFICFLKEIFVVVLFRNEKCLLWRKYAIFIYISSIILTAAFFLRKECFQLHALLQVLAGINEAERILLVLLRTSAFLLFATLGIATSMYVNEQMCVVCM